MAKLNRLNNLTVQRANKPGLLIDGGGLALQISKSGAKSWVFRYSRNGRLRTMGLGSLTVVPLIKARESAIECRKLLQDGLDPIDAKEKERKSRAEESAKAITFDECATAYIAAHRPSWKSIKHGDQWESTLKTYASPTIGSLPVQDVDTDAVLAVLAPIWGTKNETASRVRSRIELVLAWATVRKYRTGPNPAIWRNHLDKLLPPSSRIKKVKHFEALPYNSIGEFVSKLRSQKGNSALALELLILTATRTNETLGAQWNEIDFEQEIWTIPAERMKAKVEHRVPLTQRAIDILRQMQLVSENEFVFPGEKRGKHLCSVSMLKVVHTMGYEVTVHGFRSTFRDWAAERTNHPREVCEQALAHTNKDRTESAYRRGDLFLKRQALMIEWARYCEPKDQKTPIVIPMSLAQGTSHLP